MSRSEEIFRRAQQSIPGGVNSPVRAFLAVGGSPIVMERGDGSHVWDVDGREYIDYVGSWGPLILGHRPPEVVGALKSALAAGTSFGAPTEREVVLAERICEAFPSVDRVRLVNSGTEATMSAVRLARGFTGRQRIVKFAGCYHGHSDSLLVRAGSGVATLGLPDSPGVPESLAELTTVLPFNDVDAFHEQFDASHEEIACVIVEPVAGNMGCVPPAPGFLEALRDRTARAGALLIFDEVISGFRMRWGGVAELCGITPDLTTLGKIIGGGLPVGAYVGRAEIMDRLAPVGPVYQAGTLSGNPLAVAAGLATLETLRTNPPYERLEMLGSSLERGIMRVTSESRVRTCLNRVGSMWTLFFTDQAVRDLDSAKTADTRIFSAFFRRMLEQGIYLPPSQFEAAFISAAHTEADIEKTTAAIEWSLAGLG